MDSEQGRISGIINETEAYTQDDPACHTFGGKQTPRNQVMYLEAGHLYVYFIYGMYHCLNIVTEEKGRGCAVLIRGIQPLDGVNLMRDNRPNIKKDKDLANGPGKLVMALGIPSDLNGAFLFDSGCPLFLERQTEMVLQTQSTTRIGISKGTDLNWRFVGHEI